MRNLFSVVISCFFFTLACNTPKGAKELTGNISADLQTLLSPGTYEVQVMDSAIQSPREMELTFRMQQAVEKNRKWYLDYVAQNMEQAVLPYHPNFGLTEAEYKELMNMKLNVKLTPTFTGNVDVAISGGMIQFNSGGKLPYLDNIFINTNDITVLMDANILKFEDTIFVANENHGLRSAWKGYHWLYTYDTAQDTVSEVVHEVNRELLVGLLYKTGNTLVNINKRDAEEGEVLLKLNKPLVFHKIK